MSAELRAEVDALRQQLDEARAELDETHADAARVEADRDRLRDANANLIRNAEILADELVHASAERDELRGERDGLREEAAPLAEAFDEALAAGKLLRKGLNDRDLLTDVPPDRLVAEVLALIDRGYQQYTELRSLYVDLLADRDRLLVVYRAAEAWRHRRLDSEAIHHLLDAINAYRSAAPAEPARGDLAGFAAGVAAGRAQAAADIRAATVEAWRQNLHGDTVRLGLTVAARIAEGGEPRG